MWVLPILLACSTLSISCVTDKVFDCSTPPQGEVGYHYPFYFVGYLEVLCYQTTFPLCVGVRENFPFPLHAFIANLVHFYNYLRTMTGVAVPDTFHWYSPMSIVVTKYWIPITMGTFSQYDFVVFVSVKFFDTQVLPGRTVMFNFKKYQVVVRTTDMCTRN